MGIFVYYQSHEMGLYQVYVIFFNSKGNKIHFTHIIDYNKDKQHAES